MSGGEPKVDASAKVDAPGAAPARLLPPRSAARRVVHIHVVTVAVAALLGVVLIAGLPLEGWWRGTLAAGWLAVSALALRAGLALLGGAAASEIRYRELFQRSPTPLLLHRDGIVFDANAAAAAMLGFATPQEMQGFDLRQAYTDPDSLQRLLEWQSMRDRAPVAAK